MAGKKQHFIPQHFQRAFSVDGKRRQIWMYRKGNHEPIIASISDTAAQNYFYSRPGGDDKSSLDDLITDYEQKFHKKVDAFREMIPGCDLPSDEIAEIVTHLAVRSSYMRGLGQDLFVSFADALDNQWGRGLSETGLALQRHQAPPEIFKIIAEELEESKQLRDTVISTASIANLLYFLLREHSDEISLQFSGVVALLTNRLKEEAKQIVRRAHVSALDKRLVPEAHMARLQELKWSLVEGPSEGAALPDSTSIAFDGRRWTSLFMLNEDEVQHVVLPLTPSLLAVGRAAHAPVCDISRFNKFAAQAAHEFILSSQRLHMLDATLPKIGSQLNSEITELVLEAIKDVVSKFQGTTALTNPEQDIDATVKALSPKSSEAKVFSYSVQLYDFGDEADAKVMAGIIQTMMKACKPYFSIEGIRGFIFANDYIAAQNSIDRGYDIPKREAVDEESDLTGVAVPLRVLEDGTLKTKIVLRSSVFADLLSDDDDAQGEAIQVLLHMIADASFTQLLQDRFPSQMLQPIADQYDRQLFSYTQHIFQTFYSASIASSSESVLVACETLAAEALKAMAEDVSKMRREYRTHGEMDVLYPACAALICQFLEMAARLIGGLTCQSQTLDDNSDFAKALKENGLWNWWILFEKDLIAFSADLDIWSAFEELFFINRHFERLAAQYGIVLERMEEGGLYIHVPVETDIDLLNGAS